MNRRGFLSFLGAGAAALALDPERAPWVPGKKLISIPKVTATPSTITPDTPFVVIWEEMTKGEFNRRYIQPAVEALAKQVEHDIYREYAGLGWIRVGDYKEQTGIVHIVEIHPYLDFSLHNSRPLRYPWDTNPPKALA